MIHIVIKVVGNVIVCSIMLMVAGALSPSGDIPCEELVPGALIGVVGPTTTIVIALHVVAHVIDNRGAGLVAQCIDASHIACNKKRVQLKIGIAIV